MKAEIHSTTMMNPVKVVLLYGTLSQTKKDQVDCHPALLHQKTVIETQNSGMDETRNTILVWHSQANQLSLLHTIFTKTLSKS